MFLFTRCDGTPYLMELKTYSSLFVYIFLVLLIVVFCEGFIINYHSLFLNVISNKVCIINHLGLV